MNAFVNKTWPVVPRLFLALAMFILLNRCAEVDPFAQMLQSLAGKSAKEQREELAQFIKKQQWPLIYESSAYFVVKDDSSSVPFLTGDMAQWKPDSLKMRRIGQTDYWYRREQFPLAARIEYKFVIRGKYLLDKLNPRKAAGGFGYNSVFWMPEYVFPEEALLVPGNPAGRLDTLSFKSRLLKNKRQVFVYRHPGAQGHSPLLIFQDGGDYLRFARAQVILDNLIAKGEIPAVNALFVNPVNRRVEYWFNDDYLKMLFNELLPEVQKRFALSARAPLIMGGASLGGVISLHALKDYHNRLQGVFSQSGALWIEQGQILRELKELATIDPALYLDYGLFEQQASIHREAGAILTEKKAKFKLHEWPEGHNWGNWRGHLSRALIFLLKEQGND